MNRKPFSLNYDFNTLNRKIDKGFNSKLGPGEFPGKPRDKLIKCAVAPAYNYDLTSYALAWVYKEIAESALPGVYVVIGRCDNGFNTYLFGDWDTPFGTVKTDVELGKELIKKFPDLKNDAEPFIEDTFVEMQLPLLQYAKKDYLDKLRFIPILIGSDVSYTKLLEFTDILSNVKNNITLVCSANLTYYGREFNNVPFLHAIKKNLYMIDSKIIEKIICLDSKNVYEEKMLPDKNSLVLGIEMARVLGCKQGSLLYYYTSGEIEDNYERSIGMSAIVFR